MSKNNRKTNRNRDAIIGFFKDLPDNTGKLFGTLGMISDKIDSTIDKAVDSYFAPERVWYDEVEKAIGEEKYAKAIDLCTKKTVSGDPALVARAYLYLAIINLNIAQSIEKEDLNNKKERDGLLNYALECVNESIAYYEGNEKKYSNSLFDSRRIKCSILQERCIVDEIPEAIRLCCLLLGMKTDQGLAAHASLVSIYGVLNDYFLNNCDFINHYSFGERQLVFFVQNAEKISGCVDEKAIINWVFLVNKVPAGMIFPIGHPQANTLYIAHPAKKGMYLPYEGAEETLFHEKVGEFCRLAQCLGAKEISFQSLKGESILEGLSSKIDLSGNVGMSKKAAESNLTGSLNLSSQSEKKNGIGYSYVYKPQARPYIPKDLIWLESDDGWRDFIKQRIEGNILSYTKRISSQETIRVSNSLSLGIKGAFQKMMLKVDGSYDMKTDTTFNQDLNTEWEIKIEFESVDRIVQSLNAAEKDNYGISANPEVIILSEEEGKYKEEVMFILEDGSITETERKYLERKRVKLGLTPERAAEIEAMCTPTLTEAEKEYIELFKEITADGPITERKRKILSREADSLGIDLERIKEIEDLALS